jgi:regulatory protein
VTGGPAERGAIERPAGPGERRRAAGRPAPTAFDRALLILAGRPHATAELARKLRQRAHGEEEVQQALSRLQALGYLDDRAFAEALVGSRSGTRGRHALAAELRARGVARELAQEVLGRLDPELEASSARKLAARDREHPARAAARLRRRGFGEDAIRSALRGFDLTTSD